MTEEYLSEFAGAYLEDSYFLGVVAERDNLRLKFLFALTLDHPEYALPKPEEQHCYREGSIVIERPTIVEWRPGKPAVLRDPDGTLDFGSVELHRFGASRFRFWTEWFELTVDAEQLRLELNPGHA